MDWLNYANQGATRNQPIAPELAQAMRFLPEMGITMDVFSGGQPAQGSGGARVGSVRHDDGGSADVFFSQNGRRLDWANPEDVPIYQDIVRRARANGVTGFGAGDGYMQPGSMHVGFGNPAVWGAGGRGTNAPEWLRTAFDGAPAGTQARVSTRNAPTPNTNNAQTGGILSNEGNQMAQQPQGLLGSMGIQRRDPNAQGETSQPFYNRQSFGDTLARMAPALGRMGVMGLEGPAQAALDSRNERQGDERAKQAQAAQRNQTREWISNQPNGDQYAAMFDAVGGEATLRAMQAANAPSEQFRQITGDEAAALGLDPSLAYNVGSDGKITGIGGGGVNVDVTNDLGAGAIDPDAELRALLSKGLAKEFGAYRTAGSAASASLGDLNTLQELAALAPEGPISGRLAQMFPEFNDVAALRDAIVKRVGPSLRAEGSGSTSDIEYQGMLDSLGNMRNTREANAAIIAVMQAKAQFNIARSDIVNRVMSDTNYTQAQAMQDLSALDQSSGISDQVEKLIAEHSNGGGGATPPAGGAADFSGMSDAELQAIAGGGQ
jgi:hypothetical protein